MRPLAQIAGRLGAAAVVMFLLDAAVFRSWYPRIVEPDSTVGSAEMRVWNEIKRERTEHPEILAVGDSRMPLFPRVANEHTAETGYVYASIASAGTSPRCWYYMLRAVDPHADSYRAILIPAYDYHDEDTFDPYDNRIRDLNYVVALLRVSDAFEFAASMYSWEYQVRSLRGALWKGFVYQRDFAEFLKDPAARLEKVEWYRRDQWEWLYAFDGGEETLVGARPDWEKNRFEVTDAISQDRKEYLEREVMRPAAPQVGRDRTYRQKWYGKILEHYQGSDTQIIFLRMARGPFVRPKPLVDFDTSVIRDLESRPNVLVMDEHTFDSMEDPVYFADPLHMNGEGCRLFSHKLVDEIVALLGPGRASGS